jgi:hypothetical protein
MTHILSGHNQRAVVHSVEFQRQNRTWHARFWVDRFAFEDALEFTGGPYTIMHDSGCALSFFESSVLQSRALGDIWVDVVLSIGGDPKAVDAEVATFQRALAAEQLQEET